MFRFHIQVPGRSDGAGGECVDEEGGDRVKGVGDDEEVADICEPAADEYAAVEEDEGDAGEGVADCVEELADVASLCGKNTWTSEYPCLRRG